MPSSKSALIRAPKLPFIVAATLLFGTANAAPPNAAGQPAWKMDSFDRAETEGLLARELQEVADKYGLLPGQKRIQITANLGFKERKLVIDLGRDAVPSTAGAGSEQQCQALVSTSIGILQDIISVNEFFCTYGGKDIYYYHPEPPTRSAPTAGAHRQDQAPTIVMVSAGHGYFFNAVSGNWETRRPLMNGMQEDFVTPYFARDVSTQIINKAHLSVAKARTNVTTIHVPSGHPWWKMSARTWLENQYPSNPDIWNSLPNATGPDAQESNDIRARPLFANHVNANYSLHIHTNGFIEDTSRRGTIGLYQAGRTEDAVYAARILCAMKETIQANPNYATWNVDVAPRGGNYGELRLTDTAKRAALIEVGFHSNPQDAAALQNDTFRSLAVAGMAKGIRLYKEGKQCATFKIDSIPTVSGPVGKPFNYAISYSGNPTYPIKVQSEPVSCATGWNCNSFSRTVSSPESSPITQQINCTTGQPGLSGTFRYKRWLVDADGVKTAPVEHTYTCNATTSP